MNAPIELITHGAAAGAPRSGPRARKLARAFAGGATNLAALERWGQNRVLELSATGIPYGDAVAQTSREMADKCMRAKDHKTTRPRTTEMDSLNAQLSTLTPRAAAGR
jgi:hypothetical protein